MYYCNGCSLQFDSKLSLSNHIRIHKRINNDNLRNDVINDYINNCLTFKELVGKYDLNFSTIKLLLNGLKITKKERIEKIGKKEGAKHTNETKKILSEKRKKYLNEHPNEHVWKKNEKFISEPCEKLKRILKENNISFLEEYNPIENRFFSIDIAFPNIKLGIEINGNQHYERNGELKEYYKNRKILIENEEWNLIDIHYSKIYDDSFVNELMYSLINNYSLSNLDLSFYIKEKKKKKHNNRDEYTKKRREEYNEKIEPIILEIEKSNIDFTKKGWVKEVSKIIGWSENKAGFWIKKNMPEFYEKNCKKRYIKYKNEEEYYKKPNFCPYCSKIIEFEKRNNKFCSSSCSSSYNNKLR